jgi:hypothetical protein
MVDQAAAILPEQGSLPEQKIITLHKPVKWEGREIVSLALREPEGAEAADIYDRSGWDQVLYTVHRIAGVPERAVEMMAARDLTEADRYLSAFLDPKVDPKEAALPLEETRTIELLKPVQFDGKTVDRVTLHEPTGGQVKVIFQQQGFRSTLLAVQQLGLLGEAVVSRMGVRDLKRCERHILRFLA